VRRELTLAEAIVALPRSSAHWSRSDLMSMVGEAKGWRILRFSNDLVIGGTDIVQSDR